MTHRELDGNALPQLDALDSLVRPQSWWTLNRDDQLESKYY